VPTTDRRCTVAHAQALGVLLRSIVVEREPIYRQQETVHGFASGLYGLSAEQLEHLSDDRLGRALDHLFQADRAAFLTAVVVAVGRRFELQFQRLHNDPSCHSGCRLDRTVILRGTEEMKWLGTERNSSSVR
jgi:Domain of unknown function (DUF4277)